MVSTTEKRALLTPATRKTSYCTIIAIALLSVPACSGKSISQSPHVSGEIMIMESVPIEKERKGNQTAGRYEEPRPSESSDTSNQSLNTRTSGGSASLHLLTQLPGYLQLDAAFADMAMRIEEGDPPGTDLTVQDEGKKSEDTHLASEDDSDLLVFESIARQDCVVRGLIRNRSEHFYARNVSITLAQRNGHESSTWHWPLTMEPGESAPFEIHINWFPDIVGDYVPGIGDPILEPWGNLDRRIVADFSRMPDIRRAITFNADDTEYEQIYNGDHRLLIIDERAFEFEAYTAWRGYGASYYLFSEEGLSFVYPEELVLSVDMAPTSGSLGLYKYFDIYYTPHIWFEQADSKGIQDSNTNLMIPPIIEDVRIFQVIRDGSHVLDVWELIPHSISEEVDVQGRVLARHFVPVDTLKIHEESNNEQVFIRYLKPYSAVVEFPNRNWEGKDGRHFYDGQELSSELWLGGVSHEMVSSLQSAVGESPDDDSISCTPEGGFAKNYWHLIGQQFHTYTDILGSYGVYDGFEPGVPPTQEVVVELDSILIEDGSVRGLLRNLSSSHVARQVSVKLISNDGKPIEDTWYWPLSIQPGERAPFQISVGSLEISTQSFEFHVDAEFSNDIDLTRAFDFDIYVGGKVYGREYEELYRLGQFDGVRAGAYLDQYAIWEPPSIRYLKGRFLDLYEGAILPSEYSHTELFSFLDFYVRLVTPDSHPDLENAIRNQHIQNLRAFAALFDTSMKVVSVKELVPFTPMYKPANVNSPFAPVSSIPAPNRWSPDAVRLLLIVPYADEADMNAGYYSQVWIGGATEPVE